MPTRFINGEPVQMPSFEFAPGSGVEAAQGVEIDAELSGIIETGHYEQTDYYTILRSAFGRYTDLDQLREKFTIEDILAFLELTLGNPEDFRSVLSEMSEIEFATKFDTPVVAKLVRDYSTIGEGVAD